MRSILGNWLRRRPSVAAPAIVAVAGLLLAACQSDAPTGAGGPADTDVPVPFQLAPGATKAVAARKNEQTRVFATVPRRNESSAGAAGAAVNSPLDLTFFGGPVVTSATSHNVYVNCPTTPAKCWGTHTLTPSSVLRDLNKSSLILVANQYLNEDATGLFAVTSLKTTATFANNSATMNDIFDILFSASTAAGASGYHHIFHVFLPQGTDMCMTSTSCYSPDNFSTFAFCAFHGSVDFGPNQHVLFTVEPYQFVNGCVLPPQTRVIDGTASTLAHEFFETITDPDLDAWFNELTREEVADLCAAFPVRDQFAGTNYVVQEMYSNDIHLCTNGAF